MPIELKGEHFGKFYYSHDCGIPYKRTEHWLNFFDKIAERIINDINPKSVLDAGCAWGFLVEALRNRGVDAYGIDISDYAISNVDRSIKDYCKVGSIAEPFERKYDLIVSIEVLEHMKSNDAIKAIENFCNSSDRVLFSSTPFDYKEVTHVNVHVPEYWSREFARNGFLRDLNFDASFITSWSSLFSNYHKSIPNLVFDYENKFWALNKENIDLRQHVLEQISRIEATEALEIQIKDNEVIWQKALESQRSDIDRLNDHIKTIEKLNGELVGENKMLQNAVESQKSDIDRLNDHIKTIEKLNGELVEDNKTLQNAVESQKNDIDRLNDHIKTIEGINSELIAIKDALQEATEKQNADIEKMNNNIKQLKVYKQEISEENKSLRDTIASLHLEKSITEGRFAEERLQNDEKMTYLYNQWHALQTSRTWKTLQSMGRFSEFPDLSKSSVEGFFAEREIAEDKTNDNKETHQTNHRIGRWNFTPMANILLLPEIGEFQSLSNDPQLLLSSSTGEYLSGTVEVRCLIESELEETRLRFYYDCGNGFNERDAFTVMARNEMIAKARVNLPSGIVKIRMDPGEKPGKIIIKEFDMQSSSTLNIFQELWKDNKHKVDSVGSFIRLAGKAFETIRVGGIKALEDRVYGNSMETYHHWISKYDTLSDSNRQHIKKEITLFGQKPLISIIMPTYETDPELLKETIRSVRKQLYTNWELCIADDCSKNIKVKEVIEQAAIQDSRIKYIFREKNGHISEASNTALSLVNGEYVGLLDHDDLLSENALFEIVKAINANPDAKLLYSDEDKVDEDKNRYDPYFKPDWNPDLFVAQNFINHFTVYERELINKTGGFRIGLEGAQDWDLALRAVEEIDQKNIVHIPRILYHWRASAGSTAKDIRQKDYISNAQGKALKEHFERTNQKVELEIGKNSYWRIKYSIPSPSPLVSIIIPTKNQKPVLKKCIDTLLELTTYNNYEILVVNNNSDEKEALEYFDEIAGFANIKVLDYPKPFNYSEINNYAVSQAKGSVICLLNNDIEIIEGEWLREMVSLAIRPNTGAVGAKLFYPDGLIQHAGVILGIGGVAGHAYLLKEENYPGQMGRAMLTQNYSAITAACMVIEKRKFEEVGGLNEESLKIAFNDVDFCIKLLKAGYRNVWTPDAKLIHHESVSRGFEDTPEKQRRFKGEIDYMKETWANILENDPAYNLNLSLEHDDFQLAFPPRCAIAK